VRIHNYTYIEYDRRRFDCKDLDDFSLTVNDALPPRLRHDRHQLSPLSFKKSIKRGFYHVLWPMYYSNFKRIKLEICALDEPVNSSCLWRPTSRLSTILSGIIRSTHSSFSLSRLFTNQPPSMSMNNNYAKPLIIFASSPLTNNN